MDSRIKFRHLSCFLEVAKSRSVARAADVLCITQPAVSKTIKELESIMGAALFERTREGTLMTPAGMVFQRYAGTVLNTMEASFEAVRQSGDAQSVIKVGILSTVEAEVMPEAVRRTHALHDGVIFSVSTGPSSFLLSQLRVGELELVIGRLTEAREIQGLSFEQLYSESMRAVVRPDHPLLANTLNDLSVIEQYPLILPTENTIIREYADQLFVQNRLNQSVNRLETLSPALSRRYLLSSDAVWVAPASVVEFSLARQELFALPIPDSQTHGSVGLCTNSAQPLSAATQTFCDILRAIGQDITEQGHTVFDI
jgi:LysR family pca operon transcriptional activator